MAVSFLTLYMPILLLLILGAVSVILVIAERFYGTAGQLFGLFVGLVYFGLAAFLLGVSYIILPLDSQSAFVMYAGAGLSVAGMAVKGKFGALLFVIGSVLLAVMYSAIGVF